MRFEGASMDHVSHEGVRKNWDRCIVDVEASWKV